MKSTPPVRRIPTNDSHRHPAQPPTRPDDLPRYIPPQVISYSNEDILDLLGPAQAQYSSKPSGHGFDSSLLGGG